MAIIPTNPLVIPPKTLTTTSLLGLTLLSRLGARRSPMADTPPQRRYLDEPYIVEQTALERAQDLLKPLMHTSPLPGRLRDRLARIVVRLREMELELRRHPERVLEERAREQ